MMEEVVLAPRQKSSDTQLLAGGLSRSKVWEKCGKTNMFLKDTVGADNADVIGFAHKNCHRPKYKCEKNANTGKNTL